MDFLILPIWRCNFQTSYLELRIFQFGGATYRGLVTLILLIRNFQIAYLELPTPILPIRKEAEHLQSSHIVNFV